MYQEFFSKSPLLALPVGALMLFIAIFAIACVRAFSKRGTELARAVSTLPLEDDEEARHG